MSQIKIYGLKKTLAPIRKPLSDAIHHCVAKTLKIPADKRFHRFILLNKEDFIYPESRSEHYLIIEILMIAGRSEATKKQLIKSLFAQITEQVGIVAQDIEICLLESPAANWGFRGMTGDEAPLPYSTSI